jgi:hypothetical protein
LVALAPDVILATFQRGRATAFLQPIDCTTGRSAGLPGSRRAARKYEG